MTRPFLLAALLPGVLLAPIPAGAQGGPQPQDPRAFVNQAVQVELASDRDDHTPFQYRDHDVTPDHDTLDYVVETPLGNLKRRLENNGRALSAEANRADLASVRTLAADPSLLAKQRANSAHDDEQAESMLRLLPVAFRWTVASDSGASVTLNFSPDPGYTPNSLEARVLSAMAGQVVIARPQMRIATIRGTLVSEVRFGYGVFGKIRKGGTFQVERREVAPHHWQVTESRVHIDGKALFFKSIGSQEDETRSDFRVSEAANPQQALAILERLP